MRCPPFSPLFSWAQLVSHPAHMCTHAIKKKEIHLIVPCLQSAFCIYLLQCRPNPILRDFPCRFLLILAKLIYLLTCHNFIAYQVRETSVQSFISRDGEVQKITDRLLLCYIQIALVKGEEIKIFREILLNIIFSIQQHQSQLTKP